jgi:parallel beta-helix repeat protein
MRSMRTSHVLRAIPLLFIMILCPIACSNDIYVDDDGPADFDNIQSGIDAAEDGDMVSVAPGTYYENIRLKDGVNLLGAGAHVTIIDAQGYGDVVDARANHAAVAGFTLRNSGENDLWHLNCGVYIDGSYSPVITDNVIADNKIGIGVWDGAHPDIRNNIILNNSLGLYIYGSKDSPSNPDIINNTIVNNEMDGITLRVVVSPMIVNNIIVGNMTGINHNFVTGTPCLSYNNLWDNDVNYLRDNRVDETLAGPGSISVDPYFAAPGYWADANDPNIGIAEPNDPNAVWIDGDYHLKSQAGRYDPTTQAWIVDDVTSPCIDAGDPNSPIGEEPEPNGGIINMGAYGGTKEAGKSPSGLQAKYSGGTGEPNDPYQIATAEDLMLLGDSPEDYDKHFILTADIDLDPNLPGRKVFDRAVIAPDMNNLDEGSFQGMAFTGSLDGNRHRIIRLKVINTGEMGTDYMGLFGQIGLAGEVRNLTMEDTAISGCDYSYCLGGLAGKSQGSITNCHMAGSISACYHSNALGGLIGWVADGVVSDCSTSVDITDGDDCGAIGGLVGGVEYRGIVRQCCSRSRISSGNSSLLVGGLIGNYRNHDGIVAASFSVCRIVAGDDSTHIGGLVGGLWDGALVNDSYAEGAITCGKAVGLGGLVGTYDGMVTNCYATVAVSATSGSELIGGLIGEEQHTCGSIYICQDSFWDIETSGQTTSAGGTGKTTAEMQTASTFLEAGWDLLDETTNGTEDIWWIDEGQDYPRLWWELIPEN